MRNNLYVQALLLILALSPAMLNGQAETFGPCRQSAQWQQMEMVDEIPLGLEPMLVVSNRPDHSSKGEEVLFPNEVAEYRKVSYLWAACDEGRWLLAPAHDFDAGMAGIDDGRDILVFVHGHGKSMPLVLTRARQIQAIYDVNLVVFDWPSYNSNFNKSLSRVRRCGENFYNLLLNLKDYRREKMAGDQHLSMMLHSLGNYYLTHLVVNGNSQYLDEHVFDNIIMNAAAVRAKEHAEVLKQLDFQDRIYVIYNHNDRVLRGAHLLTSGRMLGNDPTPIRAANAHYIDFSCLAGNEHTYFAGYHAREFSMPVFREVFDHAIRGEAIDLGRSDLLRALPDGLSYRALDAGVDCGE